MLINSAKTATEKATAKKQRQAVLLKVQHLDAELVKANEIEQVKPKVVTPQHSRLVRSRESDVSL